jgi:NAD(P)-dependent dehydrogenase (short-subunit alcohol dehydrogenase family)
MHKAALVTGASKGIGRAVAIALATRGYNIGVNYNSHEESAQAVAEEIRNLGRKTLVLKADVGKVDDINAMFDRFFNEFGSIDVLINNAGVSIFGPFLKMTEDAWDIITATDWKGTYFCAQRAAQNMVINAKKGVILNVASNHKDGCWPTASVYGPIKAAIAKFTKNAALELSPYGIRVVAIAPGYTDVGWPLGDPIHGAKDKIPLGRFATPEEIANVICTLVSEEFSYMTGSCLDIDGGALLPVITENDLSHSWSSVTKS